MRPPEEIHNLFTQELDSLKRKLMEVTGCKIEVLSFAAQLLPNCAAHLYFAMDMNSENALSVLRKAIQKIEANDMIKMTIKEH